MKCFYHKSDLDGHCSGAIIKMKYPECEMIGVDYDDKIGAFGVKKNETVYMVDFSTSLESMTILNTDADFHWIDHHTSAIDKIGEYGSRIDGIRENGKAGCELTWEYIYPGTPMPESIKLLGRYDVWDHEDKKVLPFQYGMRTLENTLPDSEIWSYYFSNDPSRVQRLIRRGQTIIDYQAKQDKIYAKSLAFDAVFEDIDAIAMNRGSGSKMFDSVYDPEKHDLMVSFTFDGEKWKYSLYSTKTEVDVSVLAVKFGGGGHAGAAGFYLDYNLFG